ncbi:orotidine-5'-phosphate decarboxylase [Desertivirga xinjiangensis]|uniref:orotidine-5'-phosphate decarboxylase n=1 Tax=Desertivirga xinjiangensis TaxID=539206 RepID=UPI00210E90F0|nr:orotidine-5'-phosphate decarboxylase [Pedobacter xinjiangensis]
MERKQLIEQIKSKKSFLCIGLDTDIKKIPQHLLDAEDPVFEFNRHIIDATKDLCVSYKINTAFYESRGVKGWESLIKTWKYLPKEAFSIADAKRGDIGNTSEMYAEAFFNENSSGMSFDSITVAPYMGSDSVKPFLKSANKWVILLALTSNGGSADFQYTQVTENEMLFEKVLKTANTWAGADQLMFVVGATRGEGFLTVRKHAPDNFLLVPGVGAQGGSLEEVCKYGMNKDCGLLVNSSRAIIYAASDQNFAEAARAEALKVQKDMAEALKNIW